MNWSHCATSIDTVGRSRPILPARGQFFAIIIYSRCFEGSINEVAVVATTLKLVRKHQNYKICSPYDDFTGSCGEVHPVIRSFPVAYFYILLQNLGLRVCFFVFMQRFVLVKALLFFIFRKADGISSNYRFSKGFDSRKIENCFIRLPSKRYSNTDYNMVQRLLARQC